MRAAWIAVLTMVGAAGLSGCLVAGYSTTGGPFIWPGGLGVVIVLLLIFFLLRRRR